MDTTGCNGLNAMDPPGSMRRSFQNCVAAIGSFFFRCNTPEELKELYSFAEVSINDKEVTLETHRLEGTTVSSDSDRTVSVSGSGSVSTDSERTPIRVDSQDSQVSDGEPGDGRWPRQNSVRTNLEQSTRTIFSQISVFFTKIVFLRFFIMQMFLFLRFVQYLQVKLKQFLQTVLTVFLSSVFLCYFVWNNVIDFRFDCIP